MLRRAPLAALCGLAAMAISCARSTVPARSLARLAAALGEAAGGAEVAPADIRWEPSRGVWGDLASGRRVLFLARSPGQDTRDVWRGRARVAPDGSVLSVVVAHDLTNTPLGDDHALVLRGRHAAFATSAYGQEQSVTALDLDGEGAQNKAVEIADRAMAALTNVQRTGAWAGIGRIEVTFESPGRAIGLELGDNALTITLVGADPRRPAAAVEANVYLTGGELSGATAGMRVDRTIHLPKRFSHWTVDTLRAVSWIGPAPIAWAEDQALSVRDAYRRMTFSASGAATDVISQSEPPPPVLDISQASLDEAHWPPAAIATMWKSPQAGEGEWTAPALPWLHRVPAEADDALSPFYQTFVRPDEERPYAKVLLVAMDMRQLDLEMEAGVEDPEPLTGPPGAGRIPRDPAIYRRVVAAFNGAFKTEHGHYGMMVNKRVLLPPVPQAATVAVLDDGRVGFGTWGTDRKIGGIAGVPDDAITSFRQNLDPLVDRGQVNPTGRNQWGFTLPGKGVQTERSGLCVTTSGHVVYAWGDDLSATSLARALAMAGCDYAMHLDMNPYHTGFLFAAIDDLAARKYRTALLTSAMSIPSDRYVQYAPKDFFYVLTHDPTPAACPGAEPWAVDPGTQPPPHWRAGVWQTHLEHKEEGGAESERVELLDVEPGRATWRIRAGSKDAPAAAPLREMAGDEAGRVLLAVGLGIAPERHPLGLATDGRVAVPVRGGAISGVLVVGTDGRLAIARGDDLGPIDVHEDWAELALLLWDGHPVRTTKDDAGCTGACGPEADRAGARTVRAALGVTPSGRVLIARASVAGPGPLVDALAAAGCSAAVALERGSPAARTFLDRAGTSAAPRARYDETVLYAVGAPLRPRAFRFEAGGAGLGLGLYKSPGFVGSSKSPGSP